MKDVLSKKTVLFQGDSVTDMGWNRENDAELGQGYPALIAAAYKALFPDSGVKFVNRGVSGNRTGDLLNRYQADFADVKPDFISILIGINDCWRAFDQNNPTTAEKFEENYAELLKRIKRDLPAAKILLIEPFVIHAQPDREKWHTDLDPKIQVVRKMAAKYADYYLPMDGIYAGYIGDGTVPAEIAPDGVHPSAKGHGVIAYEWLKKINAI